MYFGELEWDNIRASYRGLEALYTTLQLLVCYGLIFVFLLQYRAEKYFKKAAEVEPKDAEALNKYANFLWKVRKDLWAAEETFNQAIAAEPNNNFYAANYAHFLWNTGGEDTCYPLDSSNTDL